MAVTPESLYNLLGQPFAGNFLIPREESLIPWPEEEFNRKCKLNKAHLHDIILINDEVYFERLSSSTNFMRMVPVDNMAGPSALGTLVIRNVSLKTILSTNIIIMLDLHIKISSCLLRANYNCLIVQFNCFLPGIFWLWGQVDGYLEIV